MSSIVLIAKRELRAHFKSLIGYVVIAALLLLDGLMFHAYALGDGKNLSSEVLREFFYYSSGMTGAAGILLSMRLLAEERREGTLVLLYTAPISDWQIVLGKWLSSFLFVCLFVVLSLYLPLMIVIHGSVHPGHLFSGYLGLILVAAATTAIGTLCSSMTSHQLVAGILGAVVFLLLVTMWFTARIASPPLDELLAYSAFFDKHFQPFTRGAIHTRAIVYYASVTFLSLLGARVVLSTRRWR
ncbi:MAG: hypothetical protein CMP23_06675 [Rickettsiales bacterium]|nr:hypothetical protein [Rickettsiales bacterium]|tara:strand:- start:100 stop:825 length:726 start_codon:yes stop_codon:yes gene_type:complete